MSANYIGAKPVWSATNTSGFWTLTKAKEMKDENKWPRGPDAPTNLAATGSDAEIALTWTAPVNTYGSITNYAVEYTPAGGSPTVVLTNSATESYTVTGLTNDIEYTFRVVAINHTQGDYSAAVTGTPAPVQDLFSQLGADISGYGLSGWRVALSSDGTVVVIGAFLNSQYLSVAGQVRVFEFNGSAWSQRGSDIYGDLANDYAGYDVDISSDGSTVAFGAINTSASAAGYAKVLTWDGSSWSVKGSRINGSGSERLGYRVRLSSDGNTLAVCSQGQGFARVFDWSGSAWSQRGSDIGTESSQDATGLALDGTGNVLAIGEMNNDGNGTDAGSVRVHEWNGSAWVQRGSDIDGSAAGDKLGEEVALSDDGVTLAVSSSRNNAGYLRVFSWDSSSWSQRGGDLIGNASGDRFGLGLSLSGNGNVVAGAADENTGTKTGYAKIYGWTGSAWVQRGTTLTGDASGDQARSVALDSDGSVVAHGLHRALGGSGITKVYEYV